MQLGTPYPTIASREAEIVSGAAERTPTQDKKLHGGHRNWLELFVDATGVDTPRIGLLEETIQASYCSVYPFYFTHGDRLTNRDDRSIGLCTACLVSRI